MTVANDTEAKEVFWRSVEDRAMKLPFCNGCSRFFFYPRPVCPECWSSDVEFREASGGGSIYTYSVVRYAHGVPSPWHDHLPYAVALIKLDEGVQMVSNIVESDLESLRSGLRVRLVYDQTSGRTLPAFKVE